MIDALVCAWRVVGLLDGQWAQAIRDAVRANDVLHLFFF